MSVKQFFRFVPNSITSLNVLCGCLSVVSAFEGNLMLAGGFIILASLFDFMDGMSARLLNAYSPMGKELDSLADMLSFGFAPSVIAFMMIRVQIADNQAIAELSFGKVCMIFSPFVMTIFSALRLAKFNIDERQNDTFIGLATPANAMVWASFPIILFVNEHSILRLLTDNPYLLIALALMLSLLLVSEIPMFSLKFKNLKFAENKVRFVFLAISLVLAGVFTITAIPLIIFTYILMSVILWASAKLKSNNNESV